MTLTSASCACLNALSIKLLRHVVVNGNPPPPLVAVFNNDPPPRNFTHCGDVPVPPQFELASFSVSPFVGNTYVGGCNAFLALTDFTGGLPSNLQAETGQLTVVSCVPLLLTGTWTLLGNPHGINCDGDTVNVMISEGPC